MGARPAADVLTAGGILRAAEVIELAAAAKLDLAAAAVLLVKESGGGRNVWGSDGVPTGGTYVKGSVVTRGAYLAYKARRRELGSQGCGPTQLTWSGYQDQADELGGCWDWRANVRVGFAALATLHRQHGVREGFRRYNGSGSAAERYADDAMTRLAVWRLRLGAATPSPVPREDPDVELTDLIADKYGPNLRPLTVGDSIGWAAAHAAHARDRAVEARDLAAEARDHAYTARTEVAALRTDLLAELATLTPGGAVDLDALADRVVDRFVARLA